MRLSVVIDKILGGRTSVSGAFTDEGSVRKHGPYDLRRLRWESLLSLYQQSRTYSSTTWTTVLRPSM